MDWKEPLNYTLEITRRNIETLEDFPESCDGPSWRTIERERGDRAHWVDGFWTGILWLSYVHSQDEHFKAAALEWSKRLRWLKHSTSTHDLGFIFYLSHVLGGRVLAEPDLYSHAVEAASSLVKRYNPRGEYLQAWGELDGTRKDRGRTNVDLMMNLALLFWASEQTGDPLFAEVATQHARTSRLVLVRKDGSTAHVADFDVDTGVWIRSDTYQGFAHDSCWSRGEAWALYGFATCYEATSLPSFLGVARKIASYTLEHLPEDLVPFWDFDSPDIPNTYRDSSAAAVIACGLLALADVEEDSTLTDRWREWAARITWSLWEHYSSRNTEIPAFLLHGSRSVPHGYKDHALIYGDYYFLEALIRLSRPELSHLFKVKEKKA
ncbi:glycosyl hydrolase family 88 [Spirochaeta thermophila DSM 6578]|uniref:Glycosyl hydrolase family 88 n=1 Tax=Winmispira thermophila (strain ATCC 700085 / DSM 6578 / Z-1203) TaxID=869211 RepID=G0GBZ5_WINT7|nr:glycoside hydrolase family 88 protein [Spirochaeta thermophila]AEJ62006.1 glycosyl hydrolase family 88 [Spirochaeta thermophila DSM 6578]